MLANNRIITNDWTAGGGVLEYDISYLHPELGVLLQEYRVTSTSYEGKLIFQSDFFLFRPDSIVPSNFRHLSKEIKKQLWEVIFAVKRKFFEEIKPAIVEHFIDQEHSIEQRYILYSTQLALPEYDIDKTSRTIVYQRKAAPTNDGRGRFFISR